MITIEYPIRPKTRSLYANQVCDLFGLSPDEPPAVVARDFSLDLKPGQIALFHGPSGGGKSSLLRAYGESINSTDANALILPECPLVDAFDGPLEERLECLAAGGLSEARLLLRTPAELSEGQRFRFRLAYALRKSDTVSIDEFAAVLDRPLAKVIAFNLRRRATKIGARVLVATTHDDIVEDLQPDIRIECRATATSASSLRRRSRRSRREKKVSFASELWLSEGSRADWPYFARWHYRGHGLGFVKRVVLLWHGAEPVGICVFASPAASLALRSRAFGLANARSSPLLQRINQSLWVLARVVLHPAYRGAGIAADFVARACDSCPVPWVETLSAMGQINPFFERAGFRRIGTVRKDGKGKAGGAYGGRRFRPTAEAAAKGRFGEPVYYLRGRRRN